MRAEIERFAENVDAPSGMRLDGHASGRESELRVAIEELRAQNDTLLDTCARLAREMAKYRDLYDSAPDPLVTTDARGVIVDANRAAALLLGVPLEILPGKLLIGFVARKDTSLFRSRLREIVEGPGHGAFSVRIRPRGGDPVDAELAVRAVRGSALPAQGRRDAPIAFHWTVRAEADGA